MRLNIAVPEHHVTKPVLDSALESVTRLNEQMIRNGQLPLLSDALRQNLFRWKPEPKGSGEHFDHGQKVLARGWGDCDDLAPWHAASLRVTQGDRGAKAVVRRSGPKMWHAIVNRSNGEVDDPSRWAGMGQERGVNGAVVPSMSSVSGVSVSGDEFVSFPELAVRPRFGSDYILEGWEARADLPWADQEVANSITHRHEEAPLALAGALRASTLMGDICGLVGEDVLDRADAMADWAEFGLSGEMDIEELEDIYEEHAIPAAQAVGDLFGDIASVASKAVSFVPGIGPIASMAIDAGKGIIDAVNKPKPGESPASFARRRKAAKRKAKKMHGKKVVVPKKVVLMPEAVMKPGGEVIWRYA